MAMVGGWVAVVVVTREGVYSEEGMQRHLSRIEFVSNLRDLR